MVDSAVSAVIVDFVAVYADLALIGGFVVVLIFIKNISFTIFLKLN